MKTALKTLVVLVYLAAFAALVAASGCAALGNGKLEPGTKKAASAALTAAELAAPEYAAVFKRAKAALADAKEKAVAEFVPSGPVVTNWFYKGVGALPKDISWQLLREEWHTADNSAPPVSTADELPMSAIDDDALAEALADILSEVE